MKKVENDYNDDLYAEINEEDGLSIAEAGDGWAERFEDLVVYQLSFELQQEIFEISKSFPKEEKYSLTDQGRRSSRSIGANIAEAWKKRRYPAHFVSKLSDADAEQAETIHWLKTAFACEYISENQYQRLRHKCEHISGILTKMMDNPNSWCRRYVEDV